MVQAITVDYRVEQVYGAAAGRQPASSCTYTAETRDELLDALSRWLDEVERLAPHPDWQRPDECFVFIATRKAQEGEPMCWGRRLEECVCAEARAEEETTMEQTGHPRDDAFDTARALAQEHPDATIGVYPMGADEWVVIALCADSSAVTSVFTRGPLAPAMLAAARWSGQISLRGHDPRNIVYEPGHRPSNGEGVRPGLEIGRQSTHHL